MFYLRFSNWYLIEPIFYAFRFRFLFELLFYFYFSIFMVLYQWMCTGRPSRSPFIFASTIPVIKFWRRKKILNIEHTHYILSIIDRFHNWSFTPFILLHVVTCFSLSFFHATIIVECILIFWRAQKSLHWKFYWFRIKKLWLYRSVYIVYMSVWIRLSISSLKIEIKMRKPCKILHYCKVIIYFLRNNNNNSYNS